MSIKYPHRFSFRKSYKFQATILSILFLVSLTLYFPYYHFYDIIFLSYNDNSTNTATCMVVDPIASFWLDMLNLVFCALIPFLVMIISSGLIGYHLRFYRNNLKKDTRLFKILISMDIFFFICYFPYCIIVLIGDTVTFDDVNTYFTVYIAFIVSYFLLYLYTSCSFIVHFISNIKFRNYFKEMIGIKTNDIKMFEQTHDDDDV